MPSDRDGAALLAAASAEDLERDAAVALNEIGNCSPAEREYAESFARLAALARAVAKWQATTDAEITKAGGNVFVTLPESAVWDERYDTLPAALASLLGGAR